MELNIEPGLGSRYESDDDEAGLQEETGKVRRTKSKASRVVSRKLKSRTMKMASGIKKQGESFTGTIRATLSRTKATKLPISYNSYKAGGTSVVVSSVCARDFSRPQREVKATEMAIRMTGGKGLEKEGFLHVKKTDSFGDVIAQKFSHRKLNFLRYGPECLEVYEKSEPSGNVKVEDLELMERIRFAEIRAFGYESLESKELTVVFNSKEQALDGANGYKTKSIVFVAGTKEDIQEWLFTMLAGCVNLALYLTECLDYLKENNKEEGMFDIMKEIHAQIVDLVELARGKMHGDSVVAQERYAAFLTKHNLDVEAEFWRYRASEVKRRTLRRRHNPMQGEPNGLEYIQRRVASMFTSIFVINTNNRISRRKSRASFSAESVVSSGERASLRLTRGITPNRHNTLRLQSPRLTQVSHLSTASSRVVPAGELKCWLVFHEQDKGKMGSIWSRDAAENSFAHYTPGIDTKVPYYRVETERDLAESVKPNNHERFLRVVGQFIQESVKERGTFCLSKMQPKDFEMSVYGLKHDKSVAEVEKETPVSIAQFAAFAVVPSDCTLFRNRKALEASQFMKWGESRGFASKVRPRR